jgi:fermentation-respiration switch protein FrsA (DUF1100 family)
MTQALLTRLARRTGSARRAHLARPSGPICIASVACLACLACLGGLAGCNQARTAGRIIPIAFDSGPFRIVGDLKLPPGPGPHPAVVFVHGDGPNSRTSGGTYIPIMERMLRAGYATLAWDKPGTGASSGVIDRSRMIEQRAGIVLDALAVLAERTEIDPDRIGLWGISQAGYVMPRVLEQGANVAFMIAVSCPGEPGYRQGCYLVRSLAVCLGIPAAEAADIQRRLAAAEMAPTYEEYVRAKEPIAHYTVLEQSDFVRMRVASAEEWHPPRLGGGSYFDPMPVIAGARIPVLAFFGEKDTQADPIQGERAYRQALEQAGCPNSRVLLIPGVDHNLIISQTGCLSERRQRSPSGWRNYPPEYLDTLEAWLRDLAP